MVSPGGRISRPGLSFVAPTAKTCRRGSIEFGKRTCKPNSVVCGHSSRRRVAADVHQRPTRRFRPLHGAALRRRAGTGHEPRSLARASLPIWSCSVWGLPCLRHYCRSGALLPHLFTLTTARGSPLGANQLFQRAAPRNGGMFSVALAVHGPLRPRPGRYPAHCPAEFGLSSPGLRLAAKPAATAWLLCCV